MDMRFTDADLKEMAFDIINQCREEYPDFPLDETVSDMCEAVICAEGFKGRDAQKLREFCGL
jgi:hypothetical protein